MTTDRGEPGLEEVEVVEVGGEARVQQDGKERQIRRGMLNSSGRAASQKHADRAGQGMAGQDGQGWDTVGDHLWTWMQVLDDSALQLAAGTGRSVRDPDQCSTAGAWLDTGSSLREGIRPPI